MRLLKIITVIFIIHFVRRFIQMYKAVKELKEQNDQIKKPAQTDRQAFKNNRDVIDVDFKVVD